MIKQLDNSGTESLTHSHFFFMRFQLLITFVNPRTAMHVMEEMPFRHGCRGLFAETGEAVGRLMDVRVSVSS